MNQDQLKNILEGALMAADGPLNVSHLLGLFENDAEKPERDAIREALTALQQDYEGRGIELVEVASGYRVQVRSDYAPWVNCLHEDRPAKYSRALLETLAIIAYRQPITRAEIELIRGVSVSSNIVRTLQEREWVRVVGHRDVPGKPELLATTKEFLDYFNLKKLSELPSLAEIKDFDQMNPDLFEGLTNIDQESPSEGEPELESGSKTTAEENHEIDAEPIEATAEDVRISDKEENENVIPFTG